MPEYRVVVHVTKEGSTCMNNAENRVYYIVADNPADARSKAIDVAYQEGGLEHVNPYTVQIMKA